MSYEQIAVVSQVVSAILFMVALVAIWVKYIQPAVLTAQENHNKKIAETERHRDEAKASLEALRKEIDGASRDAELIRQRAADQAVREKDALVADARESGERSLRNAQGELQRARAAARDQLRVELLDRALHAARAQAEKRVDSSINTKLVDAFVASIESGNK